MMRPFRSLSTLLACGVAAGALTSAGAAAALPVLGGPAPQVNAGGGAPVITSSGSTLQVDLNAARTIIDWSNFNLSATEQAQFRFDQRNWVVLNRVTSGPININGAVSGGQAANFNAPAPASASGNVWFYSPQGVAFGANARVNVGGLLATSAAVNTPAFLNPANVNIPFTGSGSGGPVTVAAGAQLNATAHVALVAPRVTTAAGSTTTVSDYGTALYGAADTFEIQFFPTFNNDLTLFTFIVPGRPAGTPIQQALNIAGQTTSGTIYLAAYSRAAVASEMINAPGLLTARSSFAEYGQVTITTGRNIILGQPGPGEDGPLAHINNGLTLGSARIGEINADGNVNIILSGVDFDMGPLGDFTAQRIRAGQGLLIGGGVVNIPGGISSGSAGVNFGNTRVVASGPSNIPTVTARTDAYLGSRFNDYRFDTVTAGGGVTFMTLTGVTGNRVTSGSGTLLFNTGGPTNVTTVSGAAVQFSSSSTVNVGSVTGTTSVTAGTNGALTFGSLTGGTVTLTTASTVNIANLTGSVVDVGSVGALTVGSAVGSSSLVLRTNSAVDAGSVSSSNLTISALTVRLGSATAGEALVRTTQMDLLTSFTAGNLTIEGASGRFALGGTDEPGLTNAELQRIRVTGSLNLYAGQRAPTAGNPNPQYGDFEVRDLTLDATRIPRLNLFAHSGRQVSILGNVQVTGGGILQIGEAAADAAFKPSRILISGALGTAQGDAVAGFTDVRGFASVQLNAADDILIGSSRFIDLVDDASPEAIDIARGLPAGVAPLGDEVGRLFLVAGRAEFSAGGRILQQNTAALGGQESGFYLTGQGVPLTDPLLVIGGSPDAVDLFGALGDETGLISGGRASFSRRITAGGEGGFAGAVRINGCPLGIGCAISTPSTSFRIESFQPAAAAVAIDPPVLTAPPPVDDEDEDRESVTTGAGSEEIWRRDK